MRVVPTELPEVLVVEPDVYRDQRGFFLESYHETRYRAQGIPGRFVQDNHSRSVAGTIRGLHLQTPAMAKLVRVVLGTIYDVVVDVRVGSPNFGRWVAVTLSADNFKQCYVPGGFAHGFCALSEVVDVEYKCSEFYEPTAEIGILWSDPQIGVRWPVENPQLSERDRRNPTLAEVNSRLPQFGPSGR